MKTSAFITASLVAFAAATPLAPRNATAALTAGPVTFVLASVISPQPKDIFADAINGFWVNVASLPEPNGQQHFVWDPTTDHVTTSGGSLFVDLQGKWALGSTPSSFKIQAFAKGHSHDNDKELRAYDNQGQALPNLYQCLATQGQGASVYSTLMMPQGCSGGSMNMMVTQIA